MSTAATTHFGSLVLNGSTAVKITRVTDTLLQLPSVLTTGEGIVNYIKSGITGATFTQCYLSGCTYNTLTGTTFRTNDIDASTSSGVTCFGVTATAITVGQSAVALTLRSSNLTIPNRPSFEVTDGNALNVTGDGDSHTLVYVTVTRNIGGGYSTGNGAFTAPFSGMYWFTFHVNLTGVSSGNSAVSIAFDLNVTNGSFSMNAANTRNPVSPGSTGSLTLNTYQLSSLTAGQSIATTVAVNGSETKNVSVQNGIFCGIFLG